MSEPSLQALAVAAGAGALAVGFLKTSVGGGIGLVLTPVLSLFLPAQVVLGLTAVQLNVSDPITLRSSGIVDLCQEMFLVACAYKEVRENPAVMPPERVLEMATRNGARCALREREVGSIEVGKRADLVVFDAGRPEWQPLYNPVANLVYSATGKSVETVIVDGRLVMESGRVLTVDEGAIIEAAKRRAPDILKKTGLQGRMAPRWPIF